MRRRRARVTGYSGRRTRRPVAPRLQALLSAWPSVYGRSKITVQAVEYGTVMGLEAFERQFDKGRSSYSEIRRAIVTRLGGAARTDAATRRTAWPVV